MYKKLLSNLPFNPSLIGQVSFYSKRMRAESNVRRAGFALLSLALIVQLFAFMSPPQASLAASSNDIIYGGIRTSTPQVTLLSIYDHDVDALNNHGYAALFNSFNISRTDLANTTLSTINSGDHSLYSIGRNPHSSLDQSYPIGGQQYYLRPLYSWGDNLNYQVLTGTRSTVNGTTNDRYFAVMLDCGNIVVKVRPQPNLTAPVKVARTENGLPPANASVTPGQTIGYRVLFSNIGAGIANNISLVDHIPNNTTYSWHGTGAATNGGQLIGNQVIWQWAQMPGQTQNWYIDLNVTVNNNAPDGTHICNVALISSTESPIQQTSNQVCHVVHIPSPLPKPTPTPTPQPQPQPIPPIKTGQPQISKSKLTSNLTQQLADAQSKSAKAGDIIAYQLLTINTGTATAPQYSISDRVSDILEYANVIFISDNGILRDGTISWNPTNIKTGTTVTRTFKIKVKNPIPDTPFSRSDPQSFDLKMDNVYGNEVSIAIVTPSIHKAVEQVTTTSTLPNTGPGMTLLVSFMLTTIVGYFFARSRLIAKELDIVRTDYTTTGGF